MLAKKKCVFTLLWFALVMKYEYARSDNRTNELGSTALSQAAYSASRNSALEYSAEYSRALIKPPEYSVTILGEVQWRKILKLKKKT